MTLFRRVLQCSQRQPLSASNELTIFSPSAAHSQSRDTFPPALTRLTTMMQPTIKALCFLPIILWACQEPQLVIVSAGKVSQDDANAFAAAGHPMFTKNGQADSENEHESIHDRQTQENGCKKRVVTVYESDYNVDYKHGDFQIGVTDIYEADDLDKSIGKWWWDWAVLRSEDDDDRPSYGTMMIEYNAKESITFGFSTTQSYYPISGGYVPVSSP
jgi:hypothetical protein